MRRGNERTLCNLEGWLDSLLGLAINVIGLFVVDKKDLVGNNDIKDN